MTDFADVERFGAQHARCGGITPGAVPHAEGGFVLSLACTCGAALERRVTAEEARRPLPLPRRLIATRPPGPPAPDRETAPAPDLDVAASGSGAGEPMSPLSPTDQDLEAVVRAALAAEEEAAPSPRTPSPDLEALVRDALDAESRAAPPAPTPAPRPTRTAPAKLELDATIRSALSHQAEILAPSRPAAARGTRVVWLVLFGVLALATAATIHLAATPEAPPAVPAAPVASPPPDEQQRAALEEVLKSLRQLQAASSPTTSLSIYSSRVLFAKADVERLLASTPAGSRRIRVREVIDIHLLAMGAWKARTLEQAGAWDMVGQDPAIDLCPSVKRVADFAVQPPGVSRALARGQAVAGAIPLLWECAAEKVAALDAPPPPR
jgi:hypothetical protein